jgi:hypothetical protein
VDLGYLAFNAHAPPYRSGALASRRAPRRCLT